MGLQREREKKRKNGPRHETVRYARRRRVRRSKCDQEGLSQNGAQVPPGQEPRRGGGKEVERKPRWWWRYGRRRSLLDVLWRWLAIWRRRWRTARSTSRPGYWPRIARYTRGFVQWKNEENGNSAPGYLQEVRRTRRSGFGSQVFSVSRLRCSSAHPTHGPNGPADPVSMSRLWRRGRGLVGKGQMRRVQGKESEQRKGSARGAHRQGHDKRAQDSLQRLCRRGARCRAWRRHFRPARG